MKMRKVEKGGKEVEVGGRDKMMLLAMKMMFILKSKFCDFVKFSFMHSYIITMFIIII